MARKRHHLAGKGDLDIAVKREKVGTKSDNFGLEPSRKNLRLRQRELALDCGYSPLMTDKIAAELGTIAAARRKDFIE